MWGHNLQALHGSIHGLHAICSNHNSGWPLHNILLAVLRRMHHMLHLLVHVTAVCAGGSGSITDPSLLLLLCLPLMLSSHLLLLLPGYLHLLYCSVALLWCQLLLLHPRLLLSSWLRLLLLLLRLVLLLLDEHGSTWVSPAGGCCCFA
jgi:hypothetical protein